MFKKLLITVVMLMVFTVSASAFDAFAKINYGPLMQEGSNATFLRSFTFDIPLVSMNDKGVAVINETGFLYGQTESGVEVQGQRMVFLVEKNILSNPIRNKNNEITGWDYKWWFGSGTGMWNIENTSGEDAQISVYYLGTGFTLSDNSKGITLGADLGVDVLQKSGPDEYWLHGGLMLGF